MIKKSCFDDTGTMSSFNYAKNRDPSHRLRVAEFVKCKFDSIKETPLQLITIVVLIKQAVFHSHNQTKLYDAKNISLGNINRLRLNQNYC